MREKEREYGLTVGDDGMVEVSFGLLQDLPKGRYKLTVEPIPDVPTRVVSAAHDCGDHERHVAVDVPNAWEGEPVTCILGKDELPEKVAYGAAWYLTLGEGDNPVCSHAYAMAEFIRNRWPEAFE